MKTDDMKTLLGEIQRDNANELNRVQTVHAFPKSFEKRALAICIGKANGESGTTAGSMPRRLFRRMPVWAVVLLIILLCALVTGCAAAIYRYFSRYIPYYGIVDGDSDLRMYSCDEPVTLDDLKIESIIYVKSSDSGQLILWAECDGMTQENIMEYMMSEKTFLTVGAESKEFPLKLSGSSGTHFISAEGTCFFDGDTVTLTRNGKKAALTLTDISYKGYETTAWPVINGITVRVLPIYSNNRILVVDATGKDVGKNTEITASLVVYDSLGNKTRASYMYNDNDNFIAQCDDKLPGDIVKIEIETIRIRNYYDGVEFTVPIPQADGAKQVNIPLADTDICDETLVEIKREGESLYLTTKLEKDKNCPDNTTTGDFITIYNSDIISEDFNTKGLNTVIYKFRLTDDADSFTLSPVSSVYMISTPGSPLGTIQIRKAN